MQFEWLRTGLTLTLTSTLCMLSSVTGTRCHSQTGPGGGASEGWGATASSWGCAEAAGGLVHGERGWTRSARFSAAGLGEGRCCLGQRQTSEEDAQTAGEPCSSLWQSDLCVRPVPGPGCAEAAVRCRLVCPGSTVPDRWTGSVFKHGERDKKR